MTRTNICFLILLTAFSVTVHAQEDLKSSGGYLSYITSIFKPIQKDTWDYTKAVAHNKSARKVENRRKELIASINVGIGKIKRLKDFEGDASLRDSSLSFLQIDKAVIEQNYEKIMEMEDIAEQSYDNMEAYLMAQQKADEILEQAGDNMETTEHGFAAAHNVNLIEAKDKISKKLDKASEVYKYYNQVYLIFFKSYKQEWYLLEATKKGDVNAMEQNKNSLVKFTNEGLEKLKDIKAYSGDASLKIACQQMLMFYKDEAEKKYQDIIDYQLKKDNFDKSKAAFDAHSPKNRTKQVMDEYNKSINDFNNAVKQVNARSNELNNTRNKNINNWNSTADSFTQSHI
jgi:hypothetical protein